MKKTCRITLLCPAILWLGGFAAKAADAVRITEDAAAVIASDDLEVVIEATGSPAAGIRHARACRAAGKHLVMVNSEADALAGPLLAREAERAPHEAERTSDDVRQDPVGDRRVVVAHAIHDHVVGPHQDVAGP